MIQSRLFWFIGVPIILITSIYSFIYRLDLLNNILFVIGFLFCVPLGFVKLSETQDKAYNNLVKEFSQLTTLELEEISETIFNSQTRFSPIVKEAYKEAYKDRYGVNL